MQTWLLLRRRDICNIIALNNDRKWLEPWVVIRTLLSTDIFIFSWYSSFKQMSCKREDTKMGRYKNGCFWNFKKICHLLDISVMYQHWSVTPLLLLAISAPQCSSIQNLFCPTQRAAVILCRMVLLELVCVRFMPINAFWRCKVPSRTIKPKHKHFNAYLLFPFNRFPAYVSVLSICKTPIGHQRPLS